MDLVLKVFDKSADLKHQRSLFMECFPENSGTPVVTEDHYFWKFHGSGYDPPSFEYCAMADGEMAGYYAAINYPYSYFGKRIQTGMVCDVMTGVRTRGLGVFSRLGSYSIENLGKENLGFLTGFPIRRQVIPGHRKADWDFPFKIPMYGKFLKFDSFLKSRGIGWSGWLLNPLLFIFNSLINCLRKSHRVSVESFSSDEIDRIPGFEDLLKELQQQVPISLEKSMPFMKWRLGAPGKKYRIALMRVNSRPVGYMTGRFVVKESVPCFGILDIAILPGFEKYSSDLLRETENIAKTLDAELILVMMLRRFARDYGFLRNGLIRTPFTFSFIVRTTGSETDRQELMDEKNWFLTWLNSDDL